MSGCCDPSGYPGVFNEKQAQRVARAFRRKGLDATAGPMVDALTRRGVEGATLLEVGAGSGTAQVALLERGVARSVAYDISPAYEGIAHGLLTEYGLRDRVEWHTGDFLADGAAQSDIVFLNRVVCCYPDMPELVDASAGRARRLLAMAYPRDRWFVRFGIRILNRLLAFRKNSFRVFVHDPGEIASRVDQSGLSEVDAGRTVMWQWKVWERR